MKKQQQQIKSLAITSETLRKLGAGQLAEVAGGGTASNNGCGSSRGNLPTICLACQF